MSSQMLVEKKKRAMDHFKAGRLQKAKDLMSEVARNNPADIETWIILAQVNAQLGNPPEVERCCREIIAVMPGSVDAHFHLASALQLQGRHEEAANVFGRVLQLNPNHVQALVSMGKIFHHQDKYDDAMVYYQKALALAPGIGEVHAMIGCIQQRRGQIAASIASYRRELGMRPRDYWFHSDLVSTFNYSDEHDAAAVYAEHVRWGETHRMAVQGAPKYPNVRNPDRRLRVAYVSPDLRRHSVASFIEPLLARHDPEQVDVYCYADVQAPDDVTERLRGLVPHWLITCGMNDAALFERIRADRIDILVDLTGHNLGHRLMVFTAKPAPIQVTYLGYPNTTGLPAMNYRFTDAWADPPGTTEIHHTETLVRLPRGFLCYRPLPDAPDVTPLPAIERGSITFGSFNNYMKVTPRTIATWAAILKALPDTRLLLKNPSFGDVGTQRLCREIFTEHGIGADRLELLGPVVGQANHLEVYSRVDIALDTFPYNGTTTTCEALWMGVPVIALAGPVHASRVGVSLLSQAGLDNLIASSTDDYVQRAVSLASDVVALARLRATLRERIANSALCDEKGFTASVEEAYRMMWKKWCEGPSA